MFHDLISYREIAAQYGFQEGYVREIAMRNDWPPTEKVIGQTKFFNKDAIAFFFEAYEGRPARRKAARR